MSKGHLVWPSPPPQPQLPREGKPGISSQGCGKPGISSLGCLLQVPLKAGEEGSSGKSTLTLEREVGWGPLQFHEQKPPLTAKSTSAGGSWFPRVTSGDHGSTGMGQGTSVQRRTYQWQRDGAGPH